MSQLIKPRLKAGFLPILKWHVTLCFIPLYLLTDNFEANFSLFSDQYKTAVEITIDMLNMLKLKEDYYFII